MPNCWSDRRIVRAEKNKSEILQSSELCVIYGVPYNPKKKCHKAENNRKLPNERKFG